MKDWNEKQSINASSFADSPIRRFATGSSMSLTAIDNGTHFFSYCSLQLSKSDHHLFDIDWTSSLTAFLGQPQF